METKKLTYCDLMIGDYVIFDPNVFNNNEDEYEPTKEPYPCRIESGEQIDKAVNGCYSPIPLTAEVLEKNGWYIPTNSCWWHNDEIGFYLVGYTDGSFEIYTDGDSEFSNLCCINHVHELQNLYRICRINNEIVL